MTENKVRKFLDDFEKLCMKHNLWLVDGKIMDSDNVEVAQLKNLGENDTTYQFVYTEDKVFGSRY